MRTLFAWLILVLIGTGIFVYFLAFITGDVTGSLVVGLLVHTSIILAFKLDKKRITR